jgi:dipeptidyl aminopeptidase/acylaminoacyl peptidase
MSIHIHSSFYKQRRLFVLLVFFVLPLAAIAQNPADTLATAQLRNRINQFVQQQIKVRSIGQVVVSPDGRSIAWSCDGPQGSQVIYRAPLSHPEQAVRISAAPADKWCNETEPVWSPDGKEIAFLSDYPSSGLSQVFVTGSIAVNPAGARQMTKYDGYVSHLHWSPDGNYLSVLYVEKASREPNPMAAENRTVGVIDSLSNLDIQRIAIINKATGESKSISPPKLYVFEYDWSPDSKQMAYDAALPPGDDNWYIAQIYKQSINADDAQIIYKPTFQVALPRWSPDGKRIAYIEGLMSDQGGTGGEIYTVAANGNEKPKDLTPGRQSTPAWFTWRPDGNIVFSEFVGGSNAISTLNTGTLVTNRIWQQEASIAASGEERSLAIGGPGKSPVLAYYKMGWNSLPEIWAGSFKKQIQFTHLNDSIHFPMPKTVSVEWANKGQRIQGWLLYPANYDASKHYPMLVMVHGGPAWIATPTWSAPDFNTAFYTQLGYFIFFPNARGSYGQGEKFTLANRRDWGYGDLQDMLCGVDTLVKKLPIDNSRLGLLGWSYGGSIAMFSITQTNRFKAVVAGAGAADWLSYYGQNMIDKWMGSYFGASPYDDPAAYSRLSAMTYIKQAQTPTLVLVGEYDGECPPAQSLEFWHALKELKVPTQLVIYPDEGHDFQKLENTVDVTLRTIQWFNKYLMPN